MSRLWGRDTSNHENRARLTQNSIFELSAHACPKQAPTNHENVEFIFARLIFSPKGRRSFTLWRLDPEN